MRALHLRVYVFNRLNFQDIAYKYEIEQRFPCPGSSKRYYVRLWKIKSNGALLGRIYGKNPFFPCTGDHALALRMHHAAETTDSMSNHGRPTIATLS